MRAILDTNVFLSGVFFTGPPYRILKAWKEGTIQLVISREILGEYQRAAEELAGQFPEIDARPMLTLVAVKAELFPAPRLAERVCSDPDDDKFLACAVASRTKIVVSGDKHLLAVSGFRGIKVVKPRQFVDEHLSNLA